MGDNESIIMAKIERWVFPHYDEMHIVEQPGNGLPKLCSCLFVLGKHSKVAKILYCSNDKQFFTREKDGWHSQKPNFSQGKRKGWKKSPSGSRSFYPQMRHFGGKFCHSLVAFAWCPRPMFVILPDGRKRRCYMDYKRGRMYYRDRLLDTQGNYVKKNGRYVYIRVYLVIDHLNSVHDDCNAENLEYVTSQENNRRIRVCNELRKKGLDPKSMTYEQLRYIFTDNPDEPLNVRISKVHDGSSPQL